MENTFLKIIGILANNALILLALIMWQFVYPIHFEKPIVLISGSLALVVMVVMFWFPSQFKKGDKWYKDMMFKTVGQWPIRIWHTTWLLIVLILYYQLFFTDWIVRRM